MNRPPPNDPIVRMLLSAVQDHQSGRLNEAERAYREVLSRQPRNPDALHLLGLIEHQRGRHEQASELIEQATKIKPNEPTFWVNLGQVYRALNRYDQAERCQRRAIQLNPKLAEAHANLAAALRALKKLDEAEAAARQALAINPRFGGAHMNLGNILKDRGEIEAALRSFEQSLQLGAPRHEALCNIGDALRVLGRWDESQQALEQAVRLSPEMSAAHWNLSLLYLLRGDLQRGFAEYEWRLKQPGAEANRFSQPRWDGLELNGRTILLHAEQGYGDAIQFARYAPLVAARGGRVIMECQPAMARLLKTVDGVSEVYARVTTLPAFDVQAPLLSLPYLFKTTLETIPKEIPYVRVDSESIEQWRRRIAALAGTKNVGLVWAGNPAHTNDRNRSIALAELAPLGRVHGIKWFSLQLGLAARQSPSDGLHILDLTSDLHDFADSAALVSALDLVISVDTSAAHLAGALGKPVWVLQPAFPDWRWLLDRGDSVWYPTMRLFRQRKPGDWADVVQRVVEAL